jgi:hypothetical protein
MKLPTIAKIRVPILLVLIVSGTTGFILFQRHPSLSLIVFTSLSLLIFPIAVSLLWIDWIRSRGVRFFEILSFILLLYWIPISWVEDHHNICLILIACFSIGGINIFRKLFRKRDVQIGGRA